MTRRILSLVPVVLIGLVIFALPVLAEEAGAAGAASAAAHDKPGHVLAGVLLGALLVAGIACVLAILRVILPGPVEAADATLRRMGTGRLLLTGVLPLVGGALLIHAAEVSGVPALRVVAGLLIGLPLLLATILGACAAVPHLGAGLLKGGKERSLIVRAIVGALVLGLALGTLAALMRGVAALPAFLVLGWFTGAGLGIFLGPRSVPEEDATEEGAA